jgi:hypothetical protein
MIPLGVLALGKRRTRLNPEEQKTLLTLWAIARSPLIMGGDLRQIDQATRALLTNDEVLAVNQRGTRSRQLLRRDGLVAWGSDSTDSAARYVALFNLTDRTYPKFLFDFQAVGAAAEAQVRDLWRRRDLGVRRDAISINMPPHGAALLRISG